MPRTGFRSAQRTSPLSGRTVPAAHQLGERAVGWLESEVRDWLATRPGAVPRTSKGTKNPRFMRVWW
ncbi:MAG: helix-turn-helix transcriptional regulator, partial [Steroidobacteraceae bacterium]